MNSKLNFAIRIVNLIALLAAVIWLASMPSWEPTVTSLSLFATLLGLEYREYARSTEEDADRQLFQLFMNTLPSNGSIDFVSKNHFGGIFFQERLKDLRIFLSDWNNPEHEFLDKRIDKKRANLYRGIEEFMALIGQYTFSIGDGKQELPREWAVDRPEQYEKVLDAIHNQGNEIAKIHADFIRLARKRLRC